VIEGIHQKLYAAVSQPSALDMGRWHFCETTHCRAGWVVHLAGEAGYELERRTSALFAAQQIYKASGYEISPARFFDSNEDALADMKRLAEVVQ
jgi:predicted metal-dependent hydrolase